MVRKRWILIGAVVSLTSLIATGWITDRSTRAMAAAVAVVDRTREVLLKIDQLRAGLFETESNARGYVITASPLLRADFERATGSVRDSIRGLKTLASPDTQQRAFTNTLDTLLVRRLGLLRNLVLLKQRNAAPSDIDEIVLQETAVSRMISQILDQMRSEELRRLELQTSAAVEARRFEFYGPLIVCFIAVLLFAAVLVQVDRTLRADLAVRDHLRQAVAQEQAARERAQEADQMKDGFLATISHELRTPLTAIIGWCGLLATDKSGALIAEGLANIHDAAHIQSQLVEDLLDVSRTVAGKLKLCVSEVDVAQVIGKSIASVAPSAQAKGIVIRRRAGAPAQMLMADPTRLEQVIWNLLSNSIKFTPRGGSVDVGVRCTGSSMEISVHDDGDGIAPDLLPYIFDRFRQGGTGVARLGGLGLGLSIVKTLVELHGGTVRAESAGIGKGATFTVRLPFSGVRQSETHEPAAHLLGVLV